MVARGLEVYVAAPDLPRDCSLRQQLVQRGLKVHNIPLRRTGTNPLADLCTLWALWSLMRRIQPDVMLGYTIKPVIYGTLAAWLAGVPRRYALITGLGYAFTGQASGKRGKLKDVIQRLYRQALCRAHKVFFQNQDDQALFRHMGLLSTGTLSVVLNGSGVDLDSFSLAPLPPGAPHFLLIARLLGDKGVREYACAARRIKATHPQVQFSLVGWLDENPDAIHQSELDAWVKAGTINYMGRLQDVRPAIAQCGIYVLPSYREGTPRTVLEAMSMGRAVITTDAPGCRETVVDGNNGFLVPIKSVDALVDAMNRFIQEPELTRLMGQRGRLLAEYKYDVNKVNAVMLREMGLL
ncbi:glycosyltransferase family 4 protein [Synechococcus sp. UW140]|uniref:glycosyltransferase family 4 protein n=1 Tax=Synechococcus sp. UW140 TaxID=368503 RepID=UPI003137CAB9